MNLTSIIRRAQIQVALMGSKRQAQLRKGDGFVSFTFDDVPRSACANGAAILEKYHVHGTFYVSRELIETAALRDGRATVADIRRLAAAGHDVGSHTYSHVSGCKLPAEEYKKQALAGRDAINELLSMEEKGNFSYPFGHVTIGAKRALGEAFFSVRGSKAGLNRGKIDLNFLRANQLYSDSTVFGKVEGLIERVRRRGGWLIFYTHDVGPDHGRFGCKPEFLDAAVKSAFEAGLRVLSVREVLEAAGLIERTQPQQLTVGA